MLFHDLIDLVKESIAKGIRRHFLGCVPLDLIFLVLAVCFLLACEIKCYHLGSYLVLAVCFLLACQINYYHLGSYLVSS